MRLVAAHLVCTPSRVMLWPMALRRRKPTVRSKKEPRLLAGGNPQVAKADGDAPVQEWIAALSGWQRERARHVDTLVTRALPGVSKCVRWNSPLYGAEAGSWFLGLHVFKKYLKLAFVSGAALEPRPPGTSKQATVRYLDLHEHDELDEAQLADWVKQASRLPSERLRAAKTERTPKVRAPASAASTLIDSRIAELADWRGATLAHVRVLIQRALPDVVEDWKWNVPVWSLGGILCTGETYKSSVKLTFPKGASLPDPARLFNASLTGSTRRAIDLQQGSALDERAFAALLRAAAKANA